jgi:hypothetical protein
MGHLAAEQGEVCPWLDMLLPLLLALSVCMHRVWRLVT